MPIENFKKQICTYCLKTKVKLFMITYISVFVRYFVPLTVSNKQTNKQTNNFIYTRILE